jgi:rRNA-processing protein FCF1
LGQASPASRRKSSIFSLGSRMEGVAAAITREKKKARPRVVFDSSFLIAVMQRPTSWMEDITEKIGAFDPVVLSSVCEELRGLAGAGNKKSGFARLALYVIDRARFSVEPDGEGRPDDELISFALRERAVVATVDSDLAKRLRMARIPTVITLRAGRVHVY